MNIYKEFLSICLNIYKLFIKYTHEYLYNILMYNVQEAYFSIVTACFFFFMHFKNI